MFNRVGRFLVWWRDHKWLFPVSMLVFLAGFIAFLSWTEAAREAAEEARLRMLIREEVESVFWPDGRPER